MTHAQLDIVDAGTRAAGYERRAEWRRFLASRRAVAGAILLGAVALAAVLAPVLAPYDPAEQRAASAVQPPSAAHLMGTDNFGRDVLSRALWGGRVSQLIGLLSMAVSVTVGVVVDPKLVAKAYGGVWNYFFAVDHTNPLFKDARVRQALSLALDRPRILAEHWGGYGIIANSPINPSLPAFSKTIRAPEYDPAKAKRLLAEAGWRAGSDGVIEKDGKRFEFSILSFVGPSRTMAIVYQDLWKKLGMDVKVETVDFPTLWGVRFHPGKFEALSFLWPSGFYPDPAVGLYPFLCANSRSGYCSAEMDRLIIAGRSTLDPPERVKIYAKFQELFARDLPFMWVVSPGDLRLPSPKLVLPERQNDFLVMKAILQWDLKE